MTIPTEGRGNAYAWMDFARWAAATAVLASHARDLILLDYGGSLVTAPFYLATGLGHSSVIVFFVLSGFWIANTTARRLSEAQEYFWRDYLIDRLSRLWVVLIPAIALTVALDRIGLSLDPQRYSPAIGAHSVLDAASALDPLTVAGNVLFLQGLAFSPVGSNGPLWSLAYEFWFYLWLPAIWISLKRRRLTPWLVTLVMAIFFPKLLTGALCWSAGVALSMVVRRWPSIQVPGWSLSLAATLWLGAFLGSSLAESWLSDLANAATFSGLLAIVIYHPPNFPSALKPLAWYGANASFSLYAIHFPIIQVFGALFALRRTEIGVGSLFWLASACFVATVTGLLFSYCTEQRTLVIKLWLASLTVRGRR